MQGRSSSLSSTLHFGKATAMSVATPWKGISFHAKVIQNSKRSARPGAK